MTAAVQMQRQGRSSIHHGSHSHHMEIAESEETALTAAGWGQRGEKSESDNNERQTGRRQLRLQAAPLPPGSPVVALLPSAAQALSLPGHQLSQGMSSPAPAHPCVRPCHLSGQAWALSDHLPLCPTWSSQRAFWSRKVGTGAGVDFLVTRRSGYSQHIFMMMSKISHSWGGRGRG